MTPEEWAEKVCSGDRLIFTFPLDPALVIDLPDGAGDMLRREIADVVRSAVAEIRTLDQETPDDA